MEEKNIVVSKDMQITPLDIVNNAMQAGKEISMENIEKLYELHERDLRNKARMAYFEALTAFKKQNIRIKKDAKGHNCMFASLPNILETVVPLLSEHDLSLTWKTDDANGHVEVIAKLTHVLGHCETSKRTAAYDTSGGKNTIQAGGSTQKYLMRYTAEALLGIASTDKNEDDGIGTTPTINDKQISSITDLLLSKDMSEDRLFAYIKRAYGRDISDVSEMFTHEYAGAVKAIEGVKK